ncbi:MAG TPA: substrate-binding domain-containing protein, partial [Longimicrobiales bacterium]|nr:substrate-binding domain-containing protein [Longimicrobiales bacterium]
MRRIWTAAAAALAMGALACGGGDAGDAVQGSVEVDGSSTVYPISEAVAEEFIAANQGNVRVTVGISGTGGGFKRFCAGETDVSNASRPIKDSEREACEQAEVDFVEVPIAYDGLSVVAHPDNTWVNCLTVEELRKI